MCGQRALGLIALGFGLIATGGLALAVATDFWIYINEVLPTEMLAGDIIEEPSMNSTLLGTLMNAEPNSPELAKAQAEADKEEEEYNNQADDIPVITIKSHSGLWRVCLYYDAPGVDHYTKCYPVGYGQTTERIDGADTTLSISRAIRKSTPVIMVSLLILIVAFGLATVGNTKQDVRTLIGAVFYIFSALCLAIGVIFYISAVNDEVSHRKKPTSGEEPTFRYWYGWAFFFAGSAFISAMASSVANISLYVKRYPSLEDKVLIVPGLEIRRPMDYSCAQSMKHPDEHECDSGTHNPTIIL